MQSELRSRAQYKSKWDSKTQHNSIVWHFWRWNISREIWLYVWMFLWMCVSSVILWPKRERTRNTIHIFLTFRRHYFGFCLLHSLFIERTSFDNAHLMLLFRIDFNGNLWNYWACWWFSCRRMTLYCHSKWFGFLRISSRTTERIDVKWEEILK